MHDAEEQSARERVGMTVGNRWKLERVLGIGGMAAVYGSRTPSGQEVAVKLLHPAMARRPDIRERFAQEAALASSLHHPGIVNVLETSEPDDTDAYLVMELLEGESLGDVLTRGPLEERRLLEILDQLLDALSVAHAGGVVHRDLKPDNVFLTTTGDVKLLDFGIARQSSTDGTPKRQMTQAGVALGTVAYMAPEQALGKRALVDGRTDLFALGAMAFRSLTGRHVHEADSEGELLILMASTPAPPLRTVAPRVSLETAAIVDLALAFSRDSRYADADTMHTDVRAVLGGEKPPAAMRVAASREMSTRVDLVAPTLADLPPPSSAALAAQAAPGTGRGPPSSGTPAAYEVPASSSPSMPTASLDLDFDEPPPSALRPVPIAVSITSQPRRPSRTGALLFGAVVLSLVAAGATFMILNPSEPPSERPLPAPVLEGQPVGALAPGAGVPETLAERTSPPADTAPPARAVVVRPEEVPSPPAPSLAPTAAAPVAAPASPARPATGGTSESSRLVAPVARATTVAAAEPAAAATTRGTTTPAPTRSAPPRTAGTTTNPAPKPTATAVAPVAPQRTPTASTSTAAPVAKETPARGSKGGGRSDNPKKPGKIDR